MLRQRSPRAREGSERNTRDFGEVEEAGGVGKRGKQTGNVTEDNMLGFRSPMRGLPVSSTHAPDDPILTSTIQIRLVSIHGQDIRILAVYFTEEYYQSFQKANQSTSGNLDVRTESFRLPDDWVPQIDHEIKKLAKLSTWVQEQISRQQLKATEIRCCTR